MADSAETTTLHDRVWRVLSGIDDPEMPISITDLGIVSGVQITESMVKIQITPTFTGCPALDMLNTIIRERLLELDEVSDVQVEHVFDPPWSAERITASGRARLKEHGVTVPGSRLTPLRIERSQVVACPYCESQDTRLDSRFGPTRCRAIYYCNACHNPFEHMKMV